MRLLAGTKFDRPPRCERCDKLEEECVCPPPEPVRVPPQKQIARLSLEKRKRGKIVTVIRGLLPEASDLAAILTRLKTVCGAGGTLGEDGLEVQGTHVDRIRQELESMGFRTKG